VNYWNLNQPGPYSYIALALLKICVLITRRMSFEFDLVLETMLGHEAEDQVGTYGRKKQKFNSPILVQFSAAGMNLLLNIIFLLLLQEYMIQLKWD
jgi:hypothetical protein